ncbi:MAG: hypothetical protein ACI9M1_001031, partial [Porticoccaceae bacterium]
MKKIYFLLAGLLLTASASAQAPQKMSYQALLRNDVGALITSSPVAMKISILQGGAVGTIAYSETQNASSNTNGVVSLEVGTGTPVIGMFSEIDWAVGPYFLKTETDPTGGTNYTIVGTNELMSVPYALFSANGGAAGTDGTNGTDGAQGAAGTNGSDGAQGEAGADGVKGDQGEAGANGTDGAQGEAG